MVCPYEGLKMHDDDVEGDVPSKRRPQREVPEGQPVAVAARAGKPPLPPSKQMVTYRILTEVLRDLDDGLGQIPLPIPPPQEDGVPVGVPKNYSLGSMRELAPTGGFFGGPVEGVRPKVQPRGARVPVQVPQFGGNTVPATFLSQALSYVRSTEFGSQERVQEVRQWAKQFGEQSSKAAQRQSQPLPGEPAALVESQLTQALRQGTKLSRTSTWRPSVMREGFDLGRIAGGAAALLTGAGVAEIYRRFSKGPPSPPSGGGYFSNWSQYMAELTARK